MHPHNIHVCAHARARTHARDQPACRTQIFLADADRRPCLCFAASCQRAAVAAVCGGSCLPPRTGYRATHLISRPCFFANPSQNACDPTKAATVRFRKGRKRGLCTNRRSVCTRETSTHTYLRTKPLLVRCRYAFARTAGMPVVARVLIGLEYAVGLKLLAQANKLKLNLTLPQLMVWSVCPYIHACLRRVCVRVCAHLRAFVRAWMRVHVVV